MSDNQDAWDGVDRRVPQPWDGTDRRSMTYLPPPQYQAPSYPYYGQPPVPANQPGKFTFELKDILILLTILTGAVGTWVTLNNTITTEKLKVEQLDKDFNELKQETNMNKALLAEQEKRYNTGISEIKNQIHDLESTVQNVYSKVSSMRR